MKPYIEKISENLAALSSLSLFLRKFPQKCSQDSYEKQLKQVKQDVEQLSISKVDKEKLIVDSQQQLVQLVQLRLQLEANLQKESDKIKLDSEEYIKRVKEIFQVCTNKTNKLTQQFSFFKKEHQNEMQLVDDCRVEIIKQISQLSSEFNTQKDFLLEVLDCSENRTKERLGQPMQSYNKQVEDMQTQFSNQIKLPLQNNVRVCIQQVNPLIQPLSQLKPVKLQQSNIRPIHKNSMLKIDAKIQADIQQIKPIVKTQSSKQSVQPQHSPIGDIILRKSAKFKQKDVNVQNQVDTQQIKPVVKTLK